MCYARILVEFIATLPASGSRVLPVCSVAVHRSQAKRRIEKIFSMGARPKASYGWVRALLLVAFFPVLYVAGASRFEVQQDANRRVIVADDEQARQAEADLEQHPEHLQERGALMAFYENHGDETEFTKHLLWTVEHHPESPDATMKFYPRPLQTASPEDHKHLQDAWEQALATHLASPEILFHAGLFIQQDDPVRALILFRQAEGLVTDSEARARYFNAIAWVYTTAIFADLHANDPHFRLAPGLDLATEAALHAELDTSTDPALLSKVGTNLVGARMDKPAFAYLQKAIDLDPQNPAWKAALESARFEQIRQQNIHELTEISRAVQER